MRVKLQKQENTKIPLDHKNHSVNTQHTAGFQLVQPVSKNLPILLRKPVSLSSI